jgi:hypothetical protein
VALALAFVELALVVAVFVFALPVACDIVGMELSLVGCPILENIDSFSFLISLIYHAMIHRLIRKCNNHLPFTRHILLPFPTKLNPLPLNNPPAVPPIPPPLPLIPPLRRLQHSPPILLPIPPITLIGRINLQIVHLPHTMLLILLELPHIGIAILIVVDAFDVLPVFEPAGKELAVFEQIGALAVEHVVAPLSEVDVAVGVAVHAVAVPLLVLALAHVRGVVGVFD